MTQSRQSKKSAVTLLMATLLGAGLFAAQPALAQGTESYKFLDAVRKSDNNAIIKAVEQPGVTLINTKDRSTGETALHITIGRRDLAVSNYLITHGARVDLTDGSGRTPLMVAVERRFGEGVELLLARKANPNQANDSGETPLIRAAQLGDIDIARVLLDAGADPSRKDNIAGMSALDYAKRDNRSSALIELLSVKQKAAPSKAVQGPQL